MSSFCTHPSIVPFSPLYPFHKRYVSWEVMWLDKGPLLHIFPFIQFYLQQLFYKFTFWIKMYSINPESIGDLKLDIFFFSFLPAWTRWWFYMCVNIKNHGWLTKVRQFNLSKLLGRQGSHGKRNRCLWHICIIKSKCHLIWFGVNRMKKHKIKYWSIDIPRC